MPCYDSRDHEEAEGLRRRSARLDHLTNSVCKLLGELEREMPEALDYMDGFLREWWREHKKDDLNRSSALAEVRRELKKLQAEEARLLGTDKDRNRR